MRNFKPLNGTVTHYSKDKPDRSEVLGLIEKCDGYILIVKVGSDFSMRSDGLSHEQVAMSVAQLAEMIMADA